MGRRHSAGPSHSFGITQCGRFFPRCAATCFLAGLASLRLLHRRHIVAGLACGVWLIEVVVAWRGAPNVTHSFGPFVLPQYVVFGVLTLGPAFLAGTVLYLYRDKLPDSGWLALGFVAVFVAGSSLPFFGNGEARFLHYLPGPTSVMAPALAYPLIWLSFHLPALFQRIGARNDYSYGVYIYGWPVLQLLGIWGVQRWGYPAYTATAIACSVALAALSWHLIEKPTLSLKKIDPRSVLTLRTRRLVVPGTAVVPDRADSHPGESEA